ncbi:Iron-sulfur cluster insertion protein ErpA [Thermoflexales bacterium]|jgi:iron-sulfur cluster assembly protein|nr:Iron-sulfur cluster insertion protein ErpA [Thermoflexales bacterium]
MTTTPIETIEIADVEQAVTLTPIAAQKLGQMLQEKDMPNHGLRVFVAGGGCSGLQYGMAFEGEARDLDTIVEQHGLKVYVDPVSLEYLSGATIDYVDGLMGAGFRIENPNAVAACGCGSSFRTKSSGEAPEGGSCGCGN